MTTYTGKAIDLFALLSLRGAIKLEILGFRNKAAAQARYRFGLPRKWSKAKVLEWLEGHIETFKAENDAEIRAGITP